MNNGMISKVVSAVTGKIKKHDSDILMGLGIIGVIGSAVYACKKTVKVSKMVKKAKKKVNELNDRPLKNDKESAIIEKEIRKITLRTAADVVAEYIPSVVIGTLSLGCIIKSNYILKERNVSLAAAYTAIDTGFKEYRKRVADRFGEEVEKEIRYNLKKATVEEENEEGKKGKKKKEINYIENSIPNASPYARFFDSGSRNWEKNAEYNLMFLHQQQAYANDLLRLRGFLFLNDVYDLLDIPRSKAGQVVGWIYDEDNPIGDNYIDFGIYEIKREASRDFVNGYEPVILLDFNVDGNIWDKM